MSHAKSTTQGKIANPSEAEFQEILRRKEPRENKARKAEKKLFVEEKSKRFLYMDVQDGVGPINCTSND